MTALTTLAYGDGDKERKTYPLTIKALLNDYLMLLFSCCFYLACSSQFKFSVIIIMIIITSLISWGSSPPRERGASGVKRKWYQLLSGCSSCRLSVCPSVALYSNSGLCGFKSRPDVYACQEIDRLLRFRDPIMVPFKHQGSMQRYWARGLMCHARGVNQAAAYRREKCEENLRRVAGLPMRSPTSCCVVFSLLRLRSWKHQLPQVLMISTHVGGECVKFWQKHHSYNTRAVLGEQ